MPRFTVTITDNTFAPLDIERRLFARIDAEVRFADVLDEQQVIDFANGSDAILCDGAAITRRVLTALPQVKVVSEYGIGYDNIDVAAATDLGVWVTNVPTFCTDDVADHALAMAMSLARRLPALDALVRSGGWGATAAGPIMRSSQQTIGIIGFGRIGQAIARKARGIGFNVVAFSPTLTPERAAAHGTAALRISELLARSDYVILAAPATATSKGMIGGDALRQMRTSAYLINVGRGSLVDEPALIEALRSGTIAGAALDVFASEPPQADNPLLSMPNVVLAPHAGFYSEQSLNDLQIGAAENAIAVLLGKRPVSPVNPEVAASTRTGRV